MEDAKWLAAFIVTCVAGIGGLIARDRSVHKTIREGDDALRSEIKKGDDTLHERVNDVRKEHIHKEDFKSYADRMERMTERIERGISGTHKRIDELILKTDK